MLPLVIGNWKMNGTAASLSALEAAGRAAADAGVELMVAPPFTLLAAAARLAPTVRIAAQDCHAERDGAHTGSVSAVMLKDAGAEAVILGHSERRHRCGETDAIVAAKAATAQTEGLAVIVCVGESREVRQAGRSRDLVRHQVRASLPEDIDPDALVIAYEPVWAIGSGRTPSPAEIEEVHSIIRDDLCARWGRGTSCRLVYGGSVTAAVAPAIAAIDGVDGLLVGGASLRADAFLPLISSLAAA